MLTEMLREEQDPTDWPKQNPELRVTAWKSVLVSAILALQLCGGPGQGLDDEQALTASPHVGSVGLLLGHGTGGPLP